jgi:hypothetical protein
LKPVDVDCDDGWVGFPGYSSCYKYVDELKKWDEAVDYCGNLGASLTCVDDIKEAFIVGLAAQSIKSNTYVWIGNRKNGDSVQCSDSAGIQDTLPWAPDQPGGLPGYDCIMLVPNQWGGVNCDGAYQPLCHYNIHQSKTGCRDGWFRSSNNNCYQGLDEYLSYFDARGACLEIGADLAMFKSADEAQNVLAGDYRYGGPYWLGYVTSESEWSNIEGWPLTFDPFLIDESFSIEPTPHDDLCAVALRSNWRDSRCSFVAPFLCEKPNK